jgi:hypothetical protein
MRDHSAISLEKFRGLWQRGDPENTPLDHFQQASNVKFIGDNIQTRDGIDIVQDVAIPLNNIRRIYNYPTQTANTLIVLVENDAGEGEIYHVVDSTTTYGPLLTIADMEDFAFVPYAGRGYISPFKSFTVGDLIIQKGLENEFLYVYLGDGTTPRAAAGIGPTAGTLTIGNGTGNTDAGIHLFGVVFEYDTGYLSPPARIAEFTTSATNGVSFGTVPTGGANVVKRHIVASKVIATYNGNPLGYELYFIPNGTINDNVTLFLNNVTFFDADLLETASYLHDNYTEIPAGAVLTIYHNRLVLAATFDDISLGLVSSVGEPEAINQVDGLIIFPLDGNPITNAQELRDVLYVFKRAKTGAFVDNDGVPSSWPFTMVDNALGTSVHGISTVLDSGSASIDYLIVCTYSGIVLFNGRYLLPELSFKIQDLWFLQDRNEFRRIQIVNNPIDKEFYTILPDGRLLTGNYNDGLDPKNIKWMPWEFFVYLNSVAIVNIDELVIGAEHIS